ncbi:MAG TPA: DUF2213 domain-containing protein [Phormidium sp.]
MKVDSQVDFQTEFKIDYCDIDLEYAGEISQQGLIDTLGNSLNQDSAKNLFPLPEGQTEYSKIEKFPTFWGSFCRVGNQVYLNQDSSIKIENRPEEVVIKGLNSFRNKPITLDHPGLVLPENAIRDKLARGLSHEDVDYYRGVGRIRITLIDKEAIDAINKDYRQLSAAYLAKVLPLKGDWHGEPFTHQQRDIVGNAIGLVRRGKAGNFARIHVFDSLDDGNLAIGQEKYPVSVQLYRPDLRTDSATSDPGTFTIPNSNPATTTTETNIQPNNMTGQIVNQDRANQSQVDRLTQVTVGGVPLQASETLAIAVNNKFKKDEDLISSLEAENKTLKESLVKQKADWDADVIKKDTQISEAEAKVTALQQQIADTQTKLDTALKPDPAAFQEAVDQRVNLQIAATRVLGEKANFSGVSNRQIQDQVLAKIYGTAHKPDESIPDAAINYAYSLAIANYQPPQDETGRQDSAPPSANNNAADARQLTQDSHNTNRTTDKFAKVGFIEDDDEEIYRRQEEQYRKNATAPLGSSASHYVK